MNCSCSVAEEKPEKTKFNGKIIYKSFYDIFKNSNFKILKCYNLVFSKSSFKNNYGNIIIFILFFMYSACFIFYIIKKNVPLRNKIEKILSQAEEKNENKDDINNNKMENIINSNQIVKNKIFSNPVKKNLYKN